MTDKFEKTTGFEIAVVDRAGDSVRHDAKSATQRFRGCGRRDCLCCSSRKEGRCEKNSIGYRIQYKVCLMADRKAIYEGESGRNAYTRGLEHQADLKNEDDDSPLWKHCSLELNAVQVEFAMKALRGFNSYLERQVNEALRVTGSPADVILNSQN